ncbi:hypothetical protein LJR098_000763 [Rhizobium sp. LjRoot98]|uniref:hypothetical protein n=1 Tax=unclassified Rhizobium TaxID=2613769 RepID=UPI0007153387|nr:MULTISPECIES: hypothetical protein [unclassified Rhizobium]KQV34083.1 hypothetical protein ASC96_05825 [Rhizobium sp. Root1204]KQY17619.1 hypothetical protein ASD36_02990 [Rhizobium sp. Root1334]KRC13493.1 hypothetical protein ASE23_02990 [Rhizobium sp. Root73]
MFKIARTGLSQPRGADSFARGESELDMLVQFCSSEGWSGDLSNGLFRLGENAAAMHGLNQAECGLLNLIRCYDSADRNHVLALFEQAATTSSSFCFSTTIILASGQKQPVFCIGESTGLEQRYSGSILGVFFFPRFQLEARRHVFTHHQ